MAFISIYSPVWIDQYSPFESKTILLAVHQFSSVLGTVLGFLLTTILSGILTWRVSFFIQGGLAVLFAALVYFTKKHYFSRRLKRIENSHYFKRIKEEVFKEHDHESIKSTAESEPIKSEKSTSPCKIFCALFTNWVTEFKFRFICFLC